MLLDGPNSQSAKPSVSSSAPGHVARKPATFRQRKPSAKPPSGAAASVEA